MAKKKNSTKSTEPVVPPEVVSEEKAEQGETQPPAEEAPVEELNLTYNGMTADEVVQTLQEQKELLAENPETNAVTNLTALEEGEELYTVTQTDLDRIPELVNEGVKEGEQIILGPVVSPEEIILDALNEEEFVEIGDVLEQFVNNPEDQQANRWLKKLLTGMVAEGQIEVQNQVHLLLGSAYYKSGDPVTRYQSLRTVPVYAKKRV